ncbi:putative 2OG-Fe(II) oxygenase [Alteromonas sp. H39]|uniref:putative 2OG-Fe(II) oxygenase n=1 Tax=Alteromonas sp. H39 TaxID=3389876 RepID=UPI0039E07EAE
MSNPQQIQQYFNQAVQLMQRNDFQAALKILIALENTGLQDFRLYRLTGIAYERLQRNKLACDYFVRSLSANPSQHDLFSSLARLKAAFHDYSEAKRWHQKAVAAVKDAETYRKYAAFLLSEQVKEPAEALIWLNKIPPSDVNEQILLLKARAYGQQKEHGKQGALLDEASQKFGDSIALLQAKAWFYKEMGNIETALDYFKAASQHPHSTDKDWESLALFYLGNQQVEQAVTSAREGLRIHSQSRALLKLLSTLRYELGDEDYLSDYRRSPLEKQPLPTALDYADQSIKAGAHEQAAEALQMLVKKHGNHPSIHQRIALLAYEKQDYGQAIETFSALSMHTPENDNLKEWVVKSLLAEGQYDKAQPYIAQLLDAKPYDQLYWGLQATQWRLTHDERYHWLCNYDTLVKPVTLITPQGYSSTADFLSDLKSTLVELHATEQQPLEQTLRRGTQTTGDLLKNKDPLLQLLREALHQTASEALASLPKDSAHPTLSHAGRKFDFTASWSVRLKDEGFHISHVHPKGWYSSAFYVDLPESMTAAESGKAGWLHLGKPGIALNQTIDADRWIKPSPGTLALFPSFVWHGTQPFSASQHRLTVAFDLHPEQRP